jgi:hypothetical protein
MSDELSPKARAFLRSVEHADDPTRADYDRVRAGVKAHLAASIAAGVAALMTGKAAAAEASVVAANAAATAVASAATGAPVGPAAAVTIAAASPTAVAAGGAGAAALATKLVALVMVAGAVAGGTAVVVQHQRVRVPKAVATGAAHEPDPGRESRKAQAERPEPDPIEPTRSQERSALPEPATPPASPILNGLAVDGPLPPEPAALYVPPAPTSRAPTMGSASAPSSSGSALPVRVVSPSPSSSGGYSSVIAPTVTSATATSAARSSALDAEIDLLRDARSALRAGDASRALGLVDTHDRLYPAGALAEDAAAQRVYALCALGRAEESRALSRRFLVVYPASPYAPSVRASCADLPAGPSEARDRPPAGHF